MSSIDLVRTVYGTDLHQCLGVVSSPLLEASPLMKTAKAAELGHKSESISTISTFQWCNLEGNQRTDDQCHLEFDLHELHRDARPSIRRPIRLGDL
jgi:hypothetical protein